jgi:2'-5' RNA ligase
MSIKCKTASFPLAHIPGVPKCDTMHDLHVTLEFIHGLENQPSSLAYRMATGDRRPWLPTQVALDVVHHFRGPGKGLLLLTGTKKDALSLLADEGERAR